MEHFLDVTFDEIDVAAGLIDVKRSDEAAILYEGTSAPTLRAGRIVRSAGALDMGGHIEPHASGM